MPSYGDEFPKVYLAESDEEDENSAKSENDSNKNEAPKDED